MPETQSKIVYCALQDGSFELFDLGLKASVYRSSPNDSHSPLISIAYAHNRHLLATGSGRGVVTLYDTRALGTALTSFGRNESRVEDLEFLFGSDVGEGEDEEAVGLAVATADGLPYVVGVLPEGPMVRAELVGADCDPVRCVRVREGGEVWIAGDDAVVRRYLV